MRWTDGPSYETKVIALREGRACFVFRSRCRAWCDWWAKNAKACHSEGSLGGRSDPAEIEGAMAANMAF